MTIGSAQKGEAASLLKQPSPGRMQTFCIEVGADPVSAPKRRRIGGNTTNGGDFICTARELGIAGLIDCRLARLYFLRGDLTAEAIKALGQHLLADPVTERYVVLSLENNEGQPGRADALSIIPERGGNSQSAEHFIDVTLLPGVTDPAAENLVRAAHLLGVTALDRAATGQRYHLRGSLSACELQRLAVELFSNPVIQRFSIDCPIAPPFFPFRPADEMVEVIPLRAADDQALLTISATRRLALDLAEMQAIRSYFQEEDRDPTDAELEMLAQTWSEHCVHKTFKALITYTGPAPGAPPDAQPVVQTIDGLLRTYIRSATEQVARPWVHSAFVDNAGLIAFDERWDLAFKVETHNHPSALEPFGGANTGVGGVVRDILGVSARPIANTDVLCFGPPELPETALPAGVLHPRRVADGVIHGIEDYGNKMGIPTVNGAILYHPGYTANPLVFCGCLGLLPRGSHPSTPQPGDLIVVIGGRTGRDGLRGATFSSMAMDQTTGEIAGSAVQIGHPIHEKQVLEVVLRARDDRRGSPTACLETRETPPKRLYNAITDCGAGGLSSAVGEMGRELGARVQLETVPLKYPGLRPWEIWLSEAQERMILAVLPGNWPRLQEICAGQEVEAVCIGEFEATGRLRLFYRDRLVGDLAMEFLHDGLPRRRLNAIWEPLKVERVAVDRLKVEGHGLRAPNLQSPDAHAGDLRPSTFNLSTVLLELLAQPNIRSKEPVIRRYDHEVQGGTAVKPLVGVAGHGPGDATVLVPLDTVTSAGRAGSSQQQPAVALAVGICPAYGELDPYAMAWAAVDEALRNVVAVGADPDRVALLDNFCWGNPNLPDRLGSLVRCAQGCHDAAVTYGTPFISGKDSLNNEYSGADGRRHAIPGTLLISALGLVPDVRGTTTMDMKRPGDILYLIGNTGATSPQPVPTALEHFRAVHRAIAAGLVQACHDCSEGGLGVAVAEMCLAGRLGAEVELAAVPGAAQIADDHAVLFSEALSRFVVEVRPADAQAFEALLSGTPHACVGRVLEVDELRIRGRAGRDVVHARVTDLESAWRGPDAMADREPRSGDPISCSNGAAPGLQGTAHPESASVGRRPSAVFRPRVLILHTTGTNRDREAVLACELAGGAPEIVHINQLLAGERRLLDYHMLVVPGGFSYGDDLGAGTLWALDLRHRLGDDVAAFVASGRPVLGVCNGFQALVKTGLLPGADWGPGGDRVVTLAPNASAHFECRWVYLQPNRQSPCLFTAGLDELIYCPVAHGEGRLVAHDDAILAALQADGLIALTYVDATGVPAGYPANPNGSALGIAGLCNPAGNVLGLMPHPEDHIFAWHHPRWHRGESGMTGLRLFQNGIKFA
ncbi:MAG TPA: phosphoribosylformylglycinamidine synthase I [Chloroflexi bacterium]|nr:phosphoribosylformylglycinamidine synthase I [Chloroflexota bacterium]